MLGHESIVQPNLKRRTRHFNGACTLSASDTATTGTITVASNLHKDQHRVFLKRLNVNPNEYLMDADAAIAFFGMTAQGSRTMTTYTANQADFIPGSCICIYCVDVGTYHFCGRVDGFNELYDVDGDAEVEIPIDEDGNAKISWYGNSVTFAAAVMAWHYKGIVVIDEVL
jgi:hypothetical protein